MNSLLVMLLHIHLCAYDDSGVCGGLRRHGTVKGTASGSRSRHVRLIPVARAESSDTLLAVSACACA